MKLKYNYEKQVKDLASEGDALVGLSEIQIDQRVVEARVAPLRCFGHHGSRPARLPSRGW